MSTSILKHRCRDCGKPSFKIFCCKCKNKRNEVIKEIVPEKKTPDIINGMKIIKETVGEEKKTGSGVINYDELEIIPKEEIEIGDAEDDF